jgi:anaerobic selenocysteine-containing dehydrogenase
MMTQYKHTICRICEPYCPMIAEVNDAGKVVHLRPNLEHPSGGIACHKGLTYLEVHHDPDRVNWPQKRLNPRTETRGEFVETDWDSAMAELGEKLSAIRDTHGPNAIAVFYGNPWSMSAPPFLTAMDFMDRIGTQMRFSGNTQDTANKFVAAAEIYGSAASVMLPDLYNTDYLLCLGSNPKVSRWTTASIPNDSFAVVRRITERGGKVRFVNPRKTESSTPETGPTLQIKPGTDVYFLAAVLNEFYALGGFDEALLTRYGKHVDAMKRFIQRYPGERVAGVTGIDAAATHEIAREIHEAKSAVVYMATGVNQSRQGMLCYWLVEMINFASGNLGRRGGMYKPTGLMNVFPPNTGINEVTTSVGSFQLPDPIGYGVLPAVRLPELIENGDIRALVCFGANPVVTVGGEQVLRRAFAKLDLLATVDIYRSATGELADYVLPVTDGLERVDINLHGNAMQPIPYVQYVDAVVPPAFGRRNGWWIVERLSQAMGLDSALDANPEQTDGVDVINGLLSARGLSIDALRAAPQGTVTFALDAPEALFEKCLQHPDKKIDCCPTSFVEGGLFERCDRIFEELEAEPPNVLKLISLRTPYMQNSWLTNTQKFRRGKQCVNPLHMNETDAVDRGLHNGDAIRVFNDYGSVEAEVEIDNDLRPGVVAMSHGYGNSKAYSLRVASDKAGVNCNILMPIGAEYEPMSHMSWLSGVPVNVKRIA